MFTGGHHSFQSAREHTTEVSGFMRHFERTPAETVRNSQIKRWLKSLRGPSKGVPASDEMPKSLIEFNFTHEFGIRDHLMRLQAGKCFHCFAEMTPDWKDSPQSPTFDHIIPQSLGGKDYCNRVLACKRCNNGRNNKLLSKSVQERAIKLATYATQLAGALK